MPRLDPRAWRCRRAFSMTELLVVAAIVACLAALLLVVMGKVYEVVRSWQ
jgi:prepilin-type N-terminal cleavage/methylation domain-containing protein